MKRYLIFISLFAAATASAYLSPLSTPTVSAPNGTVSAPSISFANQTDAGLYRIGTNDIGMAVAGILGQEWRKSSGSFVNVGIGGAASTNDAFPAYIKRTVTGTAQVLTENENNGAGDGVKYQLKAGGGAMTFEMGQFAAATAAPDAYAGGRSTIRATDSSPGTSIIADGSATSDHKVYAGGNGATDQVVRIHPTGLQITTQNAKPTCVAGLRGTLYFVRGGAGVPDQLEQCMKDSGDAYSWVVVKAAS